MSERFYLNKQYQEEEKLNRRDSLLVSGAAGGFYGGSAYGISRLLGAKEASDNIGLGIGGGLSAMWAGMLLGVRSQNRAIELAAEGKKVKAYLKAIQSTVESGVGIGLGGAIAGYEAKGLTGAVIGAACGLVALGQFSTTRNLMKGSLDESSKL